MFKVIVYTTNTDRLSSVVVSADKYDQKYSNMMTRGGFDQAVFLNDKVFSSEAEAKKEAKRILNALKAPFKI